MVRARRTGSRSGLNDLAERMGISPATGHGSSATSTSPRAMRWSSAQAAILGIPLDALFVEAERLPPDMRKDMGRVVLAYRRLRSMRAG